MMFTRPISELFSLVAVLALSVDQVQAAAVGPRNFHGMKRSCLAKGAPTPTPTPTPAVSMQSEEPSASDATSLHLQLKQAQVSHVVANDTAATSTIVSFQAPTSSPAPEINAGQGAHGAGMALNDKSGSNWSEWASSGLSWYYSWGATPLQSLQVPSSWEFVPMLWGKDATAFQAATAKFSEQKVTHLLSFNEPDIATAYGGSDISAAEGATLHKAAFDDTLAAQYQIGAPGVSNGASGKKWLQDWLAACNGACHYDFLPIHFYGKNVEDLASYIDDMYKTFNKPIWLTELACKTYSPDYICTADESAAFMKEATTKLKQMGQVERWSWLGAMPAMASSGDSTGMSNADGSPNSLGKTYIGLA